MEKWIWPDGIPPEPTPSWLDPDCEVTRANDSPKLPPGEFGALMVVSALELAVPWRGALQFAANAYNESNTGRAYRANNPFGWKIYQTHAADFKKQHGVPPPWFRAPGNKSSGDPPVCYYWGFASLRDAVQRWFGLFAPKPGSVGHKHRYYSAGRNFWADTGTLLSDLIDAGYKGERRKEPARKAEAIREHQLYLRSARTYYAQWVLGATIDGVYGPKTKELVQRFQTENRPVHYIQGELDDNTFKALVALREHRQSATKG